MKTEALYNPSIDINQLPDIQDYTFTPLEKKYQLFLYLINSMGLLLLLVVLAVVYIIDDTILMYLLGIGGFFLLGFLWMIILITFGFKNKQFLLTEYDIRYKRGLVSKTETCLPLKRIQHIEVKQDVISKLFGLSKMVMYTAGGSSGDLSIPGITMATALQLKEQISLKIYNDESV